MRTVHYLYNIYFLSFALSSSQKYYLHKIIHDPNEYLCIFFISYYLHLLNNLQIINNKYLIKINRTPVEAGQRLARDDRSATDYTTTSDCRVRAAGLATSDWYRARAARTALGPELHTRHFLPIHYIAVQIHVQCLWPMTINSYR